jgi:hypothetical protein
VAGTGPRLANVAGEARLAVVLLISFPKFENKFEADFSRAKVCDVFASRLPLGKLPTSTLEKSH